MKSPGKHCLKGDYIMQKCKGQTSSYSTFGRSQECGKDGIILSYEPLVKSEDGMGHKRHLCAKCINREVCFESGTYFGYHVTT